MSLPKRRMLRHPERVKTVDLTTLRRNRMSESTTSCDPQYSPQASLAAIVAHLSAQGLFEELQQVQIPQKTVKDSPQEKLQDILLNLLAGAQSLVQINTIVRADLALQQAAGRDHCAEQSVAQQTLDAATPENVAQMQQVLT